MRRSAVAIAITGLWLAPTTLPAQGVELGTRVGLSVIIPTGGSLVSFGIPGGGPAPFGSLFGTGSTIHAAFFPSEQVMIEPQASISVLNVSNGASETLLSVVLAGQIAYLFSGAAVSSGYLGGSLGLAVLDGSDFDSANDFGVGVALGYRALPTEHIAVRVEGGFRRWLDFQLNELNAALIFGVVIR